MIEYCKEQDYDFGLLVNGSGLGGVNVDTGEFQFKPTYMYKVYPNGRLELTSGSYLSGNPLSLLRQIHSLGGRYRTICSLCGSDSGDVPEGGRSPSTFVKSMAYKDDSGERFTKKILPKLD